MVSAKPDGYKLAVITVELTTLPHMGMAKFTHEDFVPIARLNADPAAITVKADAPWNTIEEFLAASKKANGDVWQWDLWQAGMGLVDFTNPDAVAWYQSKLRRLLGETEDRPFIETVPTRGYRFLVPVRIVPPAATSALFLRRPLGR